MSGMATADLAAGRNRPLQYFGRDDGSHKVNWSGWLCSTDASHAVCRSFPMPHPEPCLCFQDEAQTHGHDTAHQARHDASWVANYETATATLAAGAKEPLGGQPRPGYDCAWLDAAAADFAETGFGLHTNQRRRRKRRQRPASAAVETPVHRPDVAGLHLAYASSSSTADTESGSD